MTESLETTRPKYDLQDRTATFGETIVKFAKTIKPYSVTIPLIDQLVRSATSVGANYLEADNAESKKDFRHKIAICRKESKEAGYWLRMIVAAEPEHRDVAANLWKEAKELNLIFGAIYRKQ